MQVDANYVTQSSDIEKMKQPKLKIQILQFKFQ